MSWEKAWVVSVGWICLSLCFPWRQSRSHGPGLAGGVGAGRTVRASGAGRAWAAGQGRGSRERVWGGVNMAAPRGQGSPVVLSGLAIAAGTARFVGSWVPVDWHPASRAQGCGPQVRELGLGGAGNHVFCPLFAVSEPTEMAIAEKPRLWGRGFYRFTPLHTAQTRALFPSSRVYCFLQAWRG